MKDFKEEHPAAAKRLGTVDAGNITKGDIANGIAELSISSIKTVKTVQIDHHAVNSSDNGNGDGRPSEQRPDTVSANNSQLVIISQKVQNEEDTFCRAP
ncbi:hypothetical protein SBOR_5679 [Sclerotinia borealis F-4128]|uniref:Uncharacterized protein n=1 Tax=Sclerotinia borealis (strain F-4128) TaxID=1432307 RepID=W9CHB6_SCLBF|nr:hypothetical protein SBOR_5679 [Sclerotinia borealis F-4128]